MPEKLLSIIIPIYNEEKIIATSLPPIFDLPINKEIIIINDGSDDETLKILQTLSQQYQFNLIDQTSNQGKGMAIRRGLKEIKGDYFIVCDADLEYDPNDIEFLFKKIVSADNNNLVFYGSRFLVNKPLTFHFLVNKFLSGLTNLLFQSNLTDMETCFKLIPVSALKKLQLNSRRFEIEPEITAQLLKNKYLIKELPISYNRRNYRNGKKIKARDGLQAIITLWREKLFSR